MPARTSTKKSARRQQRQARQKRMSLAKDKQPSLDALLEAAATSMASLDVETSYQSYRQASSLLRTQLPSNLPDVPKDGEFATDHGLTLIQVLERMGECQVSMGDPDLAREHFAEALQLLERQQQQQQGDQQMELSSATCSFLETHASLCLYIGQLSLGREALKAYQQGVSSLEHCIQKMVQAMDPVMGQHRQQTQQQQQQQHDVSPSCDESASQADSDNPIMRCGGGDDDDIDTDMILPQSTQEHPQQDHPPSQVPAILLQDLTQKLSKAYCNLAELYLTDLCEEDTAESDCQHYLEKALQLKDADGEPLVDALQTMANLRLSQDPERRLQAVPFILRAYEKQRVGSEALAALVGLNHGKYDDEGLKPEEDQSRELLQVEAANNLPEFEFRCQTAKLLLECATLLKGRRGGGVAVAAGATTSGASSIPPTPSQEEKCISAAISVLGSLLAQNDEVVEIWYLTGCAFASKTPPLVETSRFYLDHALEMLTEIRKSLQQEAQFASKTEQDDLQENLYMNTIQMEDVQRKLDELRNVDIGADEEDTTMEE